MNTPTLGRLERVDLRDAWTSESNDFTPWLARDENLKLLGEAIGLDLLFEAREKGVGPFRADILCKDLATDSWVLVENQLERTDHTHLGQLLVYAAGLQAVTIVWIAERFTDEHRAAFDWLNQATQDGIHFFGLEIELWRIGDSPLAPKFNLVCQPNDWRRTVATTAQRIASGELTELEQKQLAFWQAAWERLGKAGTSARKPQARHKFDMPIGHSGFKITLTRSARARQLWVGLVCRDTAYWPALDRLRGEVAGAGGGDLVWAFQDGRKHNYVSAQMDDVDPDDETDWPRQHAWMAEQVERLDKLFRDRLPTLVPSGDAG